MIQRWFLCIVLLLTLVLHSQGAETIQIGDHYDDVITKMGKPTGRMTMGNQTILTYDIGTITLKSKMVIDVNITARTQKAAKRRKAKVTFAKEQEARGLVQYDGKWITPAQRDQHVQTAQRAKARAERNRILDHSLTKIECHYTKNEKFKGLVSAGAPLKGKYNYTVYIPHGYNSPRKKSVPCLFIASPNGQANMGAAEKRMIQEGWVVVMLKQSSSTAGWNSCAGNFLAAYDDALKRFKIDPRHCYATGFSGGARAVTLFAQLRPLSGLILQGAGFWWSPKDGPQWGAVEQNPDLPIYLLMGTRDPNIREVEMFMEKVQTHRVQIVDTGHRRAPALAMGQAFDWIKEQTGLR